MTRRLSRLVTPQLRLRLAWVLLLGSLVGWPLSVLTFASGEPPTVLGLSWLAITITALDVVSTADVRVQHERERDEAAG